MKAVETSRIKSIDVFRGITMFLLIADFTGTLELIPHESTEGLSGIIGQQFHHHPWNGLRFWDLIQPFFMFIVGLSLPFAIRNRIKKGENSKQIFYHVLKRAAILLFLGWALYCIGNGRITTYFQNVLAQIGVTYLIAYLIQHRSFKFQIVFSMGLLALTYALYNFLPIDGFSNPYVKNENFGTWFDTLYGGEDLGGGWASFNAIPTTAHTIWGVLVAKLLMTERTVKDKLKYLLIAGALLVVLGYALDPVIPIIKRICTTSFVLVSGGWAILAMAFLYWLVDIKKMDGNWTLFFGVVSMNSLFIYLFAHLNGGGLLASIFKPFAHAVLNEASAELIISLLVWAGLWGICYWMYKKKLFIKI